MTGPDLSALLEGLIKADVNFILVGGLAAVVQGTPVITMDVDIVHNRSPENIVKLLAFLKSIGAFHRRLDDKVIEPTERDISGEGHALFSTQLGPLYVLAVIEEGKTYDDLLEHTVDVKFRSHTIKVLDLKMMIELKETQKTSKTNSGSRCWKKHCNNCKKRMAPVRQLEKLETKTSMNIPLIFRIKVGRKGQLKSKEAGHYVLG